MPNYDCPPTLNDSQVLEFCKNGFLMLPGVVPAEINQRTLAYLEARPTSEPTEILNEDWFLQNVIVQPAVAGAVRSLLGPNFGLPILMSNHRVQCTQPARQWHRDGRSQQGPQLNSLKVFNYPRDGPPQPGPPELLPGPHPSFTP